VPSTLPDGEPAPVDGALPASAIERLGERGFGVYVHVPFCASRCGYCDFNTYTPAELGGPAPMHGYADQVLAEIALARTVLDRPAKVDTVFFGGGTPTMLPPEELGRILHGLDEAFGLAADAEVTTEANPESVTYESLKALRHNGFTRISLGMQSVAPHVLALLDRRHTPGRAAEAAQEARAAGFDHVNLDLIYGTPGESADDFAASLSAAVTAGVDHVSAYSLIVEDGTRLAARVRRGEIARPDDDVAADRYLLADTVLTGAGLDWYEVSNWAKPDGQCRHNLVYWRGGDWWGFGPGAHSHVGGVRWWNVKHPSSYGRRLADGSSPAQARERLGPAERHAEDVMLGLRLSDGLSAASVGPVGLVAELVDEGLLERRDDRVVLTLRGRLLADAVILRLL
jgi:oxygen-independent coproporphyrinogen-3 oxidase